ncbi:interleukin-6 [Erinaceus europaeus]|uniref:Interleukin-6 n=1 Tax=Erinaceus europaeus TaxID=9365 RepID=A0A1S2ZSU1_ERIEU|nr:interleukin-6 [Erinaceus europaeus]
MSSLSTSIFSSLAFSLGLLLGMATALPIHETTSASSHGDATLSTTAFSSKTEGSIRYILGKISELKQEICENHSMCRNGMVALEDNNLNFPQITEDGGCLPSGFNKETCLNTITTSLSEYQPYLNYLQENYNLNERTAIDIQTYFKVLIRILKQMENNADEITTPNPVKYDTLSKMLRSQNNWQMNTTFYLTLQSLERFLQYTVRAIRMM